MGGPDAGYSRSGPRSGAASSASKASGARPLSGAASEPILNLTGDVRKGSGPLMPRGHLHLSSEDVAKVFFSTSSRSMLVDHGKKDSMSTGRAMRDKADYKALSVGPGYERSTAPPLLREFACTHNRTFVEKTLANFGPDREIQGINLRNGKEGESAVGGFFSPETTHAKYYRRHDKDGRGRSYKPANPMHVDLKSKIGEISASKRTFKLHDKGQADRFRGESCKPPDVAGVVPDPKVFTFDFRSANDRTFQRDFARRSEYPKTCNPAKRGAEQEM